MAVAFDDYFERYRNIVLTRVDGVVEMRLHSNGDALLWNDNIHEELVDALYNVGRDPSSRVLILTGSGDDFCPGPDPDSFHFDGAVPPIGLDHVYAEGKELITNLLAVRVPVISAVHGRAAAHAELALFSDIVLAAEDAVFSDSHFNYGIVPGDGIQIAFMNAFGSNRGRYLLLTGEGISAADAKACGAVAEVLPNGDLMDRARTIARTLAKQPVLALRYTRETLVRELQRLAQAHLGYGLALEGFGSGYGAWGSTLHAQDRGE
jgi:enoyl-CoA hydratase/carnithine racemase